MRLHLDRERDEPLLWEETVVLDPVTLGQELIVELSPVDVRGRVDRIHVDPAGQPRGGASRSRAASAAGPADFQVGMDLHYRQALACTRCLQPVRSEVSTHVELAVTARPKAKNPTPKPPRAGEPHGRSTRGKHARPDDTQAEAGLELEKDELGVLSVEGEHLETEPLIAEQILLEVPMKPLCAPECRGLCPRCGADRNATPECCEEPAGDERWEALGALRDRLSADGR